jgi:hypothetical protein
MRKNIIVLLLSIILENLGFADDGFLSGTVGGNVFLSKSDSIQMVKEMIYVNMFRDSCNVSCRFWFVNKGTSVIDTVGFPDFFYGKMFQTKPIKHFYTFINGKIVKTDRNKEVNDKDSIYESTRFWYTWKCSFPKNDTVIIDNSYTASWGLSPWGDIEFSYVLGTATSWLSPIQKGTIILNHERLGSKMFINHSFDYIGKGLNINETDDIVVINFKNYVPAQNEEIHFNTFSFWAYPYPQAKSDATLDIASAKQLIKMFFNSQSKIGITAQDLINEIYAREGYIFRDKRLAEYFKKKKWYKPDSSFKLEKLSSFEQICITALKEMGKDNNIDE